MVSGSDFGLSADFYGEIVIAAGNTGLSGKGAAIAAPQYRKKERSSVAVQVAACFFHSSKGAQSGDVFRGGTTAAAQHTDSHV